MLTMLTFGIPQLCDTSVNTFFRAEGARNESIWNLFCMGINEYEFGFMHNEILTEDPQEFKDFYELLSSRTAEQNINLFGKKIFWTWSQGTYQAQRYAFGSDSDNVLDKFLYKTPVTAIFLKDQQPIRQFINMFCRAQYFALFFLMIIGLWKMDISDRNKYRPFIYLMFGTFLILIFYEMKSRYVLHCMISMCVMAFYGLQCIKNYQKSHKILS